MRSIRLSIPLPVVFFILFSLLTAFIVSVVFSSSTFAAARFDDLTLEEKNRSTSYYITLQGCIRNNMHTTISADSSNIGPLAVNWFDDNNAHGYVYPDGKRDCRDIMKVALDLWDISADDFLTGIGYAKKSGTSYDWSGASDGAKRQVNFDRYVKDELKTNDPSNPGAAAAYMRYDKWWDTQCVVKKFGKYSDIKDTTIKERVDKGYTEVTGGYTIKFGKIKRTNGIEWAYSYKTIQHTEDGSFDYNFTAYGYHNSIRKVNCEDVAVNIAKYAPDYLNYLDKQAVEDLCKSRGYTNVSAIPFGTRTLSACIDGSSNASNPDYCASKYVPQELTYHGSKIVNSQKNELAACNSGAGITAAEIAAAKKNIIAAEEASLMNNVVGTKETSCVIEVIGWIVCPAIGFLSNIADGAFGFLADNFLETNIKAFDTTAPTYKAWSVIRTIANVLFVIVFLIIIFSQLTGQAISNYGIKKMMPRLIIAAILVNVSFLISQLAVDLSNILGYSIRSVFDGITGAAVQTTATQSMISNASPFATGEGFAGVAGGILAGGVAGVALYAMLSTFIPVIIAAVVALVMILFILVARQAIIILLVVLSPLAFVALLLPNTENMFKAWRKMLTAMLLLFPIIALVFGASEFASKILLSTFTSSNSLGAGNDPSNFFGQIIAAAVLVLPLFVVPGLLKKSLDGIPMVGQLANKMATRANANVANKTKQSYTGSKFSRGRTIRKAAKEEFRNRKYAESLTQDGVRGRMAQIASGGLSSLGITKAQRFQNDRVSANASATVANAEAKDIKDAQVVLSNDIVQEKIRVEQAGGVFNQDDFLTARATGDVGHEKATTIQKAAAMHQLAALGRDGKVRDLRTHFKSTGNTEASTYLEHAVQANVGSLIGKAPDIIKGSGPAFDSTAGDQVAGYSSGTAEAHIKHIQELHITKETTGAAASAPGAGRTEREAAAKAQAKYKEAIASFNSAVQDIHNTPTLQSKFTGDVGRTYHSEVSKLGASGASGASIQADLSAGMSMIDAVDGKIR